MIATTEREQWTKDWTPIARDVGQASLAAMQGIEPYVRYKVGEQL